MPILAVLILSFFSFTKQAAAQRTVEPINLSLHHFLSQTSSTQTQFLDPFVDKINKDSGGDLTIKIYPSMSLGGKPAELYRQVKDGSVDIIWTVTGYTPGLFPRSEVFELPTVHTNSAFITNQAIFELMPKLAADFKDVKVLLLHVHAGNALHLKNSCVSNSKQLLALKIRTPSRTGAWLITSWGADPVAMPVPSLPLSLAKGVVDGALIPYQIVPSLSLHEITNCSISMNEDKRFGTSVFLLAMNKRSYNNLPDKLKKVIDDNIKIDYVKQVGKTWDNMEEMGRKLQKDSGSPVLTLDKNQTPKFEKLNATVEKQWVEQQKKDGKFDPLPLLRQAKESINKLSK